MTPDVLSPTPHPARSVRPRRRGHAGARRWRQTLLLTAYLLAALLLPGWTSLAAASGPAGQFTSHADACLAPSPADVDALGRATDAYMLARYPAVYGSARVGRVVSDWAIVIVLPRVPADNAAVILHRVSGVWTVVAGPGTAFPPATRPLGMPDELLDPTPCG